MKLRVRIFFFLKLRRTFVLCSIFDILFAPADGFIYFLVADRVSNQIESWQRKFSLPGFAYTGDSASREPSTNIWFTNISSHKLSQLILTQNQWVTFLLRIPRRVHRNFPFPFETRNSFSNQQRLWYWFFFSGAFKTIPRGLLPRKAVHRLF